MVISCETMSLLLCFEAWGNSLHGFGCLAGSAAPGPRWGCTGRSTALGTWSVVLKEELQHPSGHGELLCHQGGARSRAAALPHKEECPWTIGVWGERLQGTLGGRPTKHTLLGSYCWDLDLWVSNGGSSCRTKWTTWLFVLETKGRTRAPKSSRCRNPW